MNGENEVVRPPHPASAEKARATEFLRNADTPTYKELTEIIGEDSQGIRGRNIILAARKTLEDEGVFFTTARGVGLRRCDDPQKNNLVTRGVQGLRRKVRRVGKTQVSIDYTQLSDPAKLQYSVNGARISVMEAASSVKFGNEIQKHGPIQFEQPDLIKLLKAKKQKSAEQSRA